MKSSPKPQENSYSCKVTAVITYTWRYTPACLVIQLSFVVERAIIDERFSRKGTSALFMAGNRISPWVRDTLLGFGVFSGPFWKPQVQHGFIRGCWTLELKAVTRKLWVTVAFFPISILLSQYLAAASGCKWCENFFFFNIFCNQAECEFCGVTYVTGGDFKFCSESSLLVGWWVGLISVGDMMNDRWAFAASHSWDTDGAASLISHSHPGCRVSVGVRNGRRRTQRSTERRRCKNTFAERREKRVCVYVCVCKVE